MKKKNQVLIAAWVSSSKGRAWEVFAKANGRNKSGQLVYCINLILSGQVELPDYSKPSVKPKTEERRAA